MTMLLRNKEDRVLEALRECSPSLEQLGRWDWRLGINGQIRARVQDGWLSLSASPDGRKFKPDARSLLRLLEWNREVGGGGKFVLLPDRSPGIRAEIPLEEEGSLVRRVCDAYVGMENAMKRSGSPRFRDDPGRYPVITSHNGGSEWDPRDLCREADWQFTERESGIAVPLEGPGFHQAIVRNDRGNSHANVTLLEWESLPDECVLAIASLLLTAGAVVRMVRPFAQPDRSHHKVGFEVALRGEPSAAEVGHALSSLSVACRSCAQELKALENPDIAGAYLGIRGWQTSRSRH